MRNVSKTLSLLCVCLMIFSCSKQENRDEQMANGLINFKSSVVADADFLSRGEVIKDDNHFSMAVFCHNTGISQFADVATSTTPNWMYKANVTRGSKDANWGITMPNPDDGSVNPFWDGDSYHSFFAITPYDKGNEIGTFSAKDDVGAPTFNYTVPALPTEHKDILHSAVLDQKYSTANGSVNFPFNHSLTQLRFFVGKSDDTPVDDVIRIKSFTFSDVVNSSVLTFNADGSAAWENNSTKSVISTTTENGLKDEFATTTLTEITATNGAMMVIPQTFDASAKMTIVIEVNSVEETKEFLLKDIGGEGMRSWGMGKSYNYKFTYDKIVSSMGVTIEPWISKEIDGDIDSESVIKVPSSVLMNYEENNSYTKSVSYTGNRNVKIFVGGQEIVYSNGGVSLIPSGTKPAWLENATWSRNDTEGKTGNLTFTIN